MSDRVPYVVPGCARTRGDRKGDRITPGMEWVCHDHWQAIPRPIRSIYSRAKRRAKRLGDHWWPAANRLWSRVKREAIERGIGIR